MFFILLYAEKLCLKIHVHVINKCVGMGHLTIYILDLQFIIHLLFETMSFNIFIAVSTRQSPCFLSLSYFRFSLLLNYALTFLHASSCFQLLQTLVISIFEDFYSDMNFGTFRFILGVYEKYFTAFTIKTCLHLSPEII